MREFQGKHSQQRSRNLLEVGENIGSPEDRVLAQAEPTQKNFCGRRSGNASITH